MRSVKERIRTLRQENQECTLKITEVEREHEKQMKLNNEKVRIIESKKRELIKTTINLTEQGNKMKEEAEERRNEEREETMVGKRENKALKDENNKLKDSIELMRNEMEEKNRLITQIDNLNRRLHTHNNHLTELCFIREPIEKDIEVGNKNEGGKKKKRTQ